MNNFLFYLENQEKSGNFKIHFLWQFCKRIQRVVGKEARKCHTTKRSGVASSTSRRVAPRNTSRSSTIRRNIITGLRIPAAVNPSRALVSLFLSPRSPPSRARIRPEQAVHLIHAQVRVFSFSFDHPGPVAASAATATYTVKFIMSNYIKYIRFKLFLIVSI